MTGITWRQIYAYSIPCPNFTNTSLLFNGLDLEIDKYLLKVKKVKETLDLYRIDEESSSWNFNNGDIFFL